MNAQLQPEERRVLDRVKARELELWADLAAVSNAVRDAPCLEFATYRGLSVQPRTIRTGTAALRALVDQDFAEFGRLVHAGVAHALHSRAEDEIDEEEGA